MSSLSSSSVGTSSSNIANVKSVSWISFNGPSIPDELLIARDEGRVVFFCGAGVSMAFAGLADFFGLANEVIRRLGVATIAQ